MCLTGGFALAMMLDDCVIAPVLSQPSLPVAVTSAQKRDLGIDEDTSLILHLASVKEKPKAKDYSVSEDEPTETDAASSSSGCRPMAMAISVGRPRSRRFWKIS